MGRPVRVQIPPSPSSSVFIAIELVAFRWISDPAEMFREILRLLRLAQEALYIEDYY